MTKKQVETTKRRIGRPPRARWPEVPEVFRGPRSRMSYLDRYAYDLATSGTHAGVVPAKHKGVDIDS